MTESEKPVTMRVIHETLLRELTEIHKQCPPEFVEAVIRKALAETADNILTRRDLTYDQLGPHQIAELVWDLCLGVGLAVTADRFGLQPKSEEVPRD